MAHATIDCATRLRVLANETRLAVLRELLESPKHVGEINDVLGTDQSLLSHHLRVLRDAGLVVAERDGKAVLYRVAPDVATSGTGEVINLGCCRISFT